MICQEVLTRVSILNFDRETKVNDCKYKNKIPVLNRRFHYFHFDCLARVSTAKQLSILEKVIVIQYHHNYPIGRRGFTLVELVLLVAIIGIIAGIAVPSYSSYIKKAKIKQAVADLKTISLEIEMFKAGNPGLPANLATVPGINLIDPWGNPYQYLNFETVKGKGKMRKDRFLVPINSDYDLYSMGEDGRSVPPLTAKSSRDDIIRANDGQYVGLAEKY